MNAEYPLEQLAMCADGTPQRRFARKAGELLRENEDIVLKITDEGLRIFARLEADLAAQRELLRDAFGASVQFSAPVVRHLLSDDCRHPIMGFRIVTGRAEVKTVEDSLKRRRAAISDIEIQTQGAVIRGQAPLATLMGYPRTLRRLSGGSAHATLWLSHYEPLWTYSRETMACYAG
jgi:predicted deacylase